MVKNLVDIRPEAEQVPEGLTPVKMPFTLEMFPAFRTAQAVQNKVEKNLMMKTWGGLGDQICAEPTLRYAFKTFKGLDISLASEKPELFSHLPFKRVFNLSEEQPLWQKYFVFDTIYPPSHLQWQFMSHMLINAVDYVTLCAFRSQLPVADKEILIKTGEESAAIVDVLQRKFEDKPVIVVHPGRHWPIKTFPEDFWNSVLSELNAGGVTPVLIGAETDDNRGTVNVESSFCIDLRGKTSILETVELLQRYTDVLLTNDSSPLHMAASSSPDDPTTGNAWIGFIATCKHPDYIQHWRKGQWAWRMQNHGLSGIWDVLDFCPNKENEIKVDQIEESMLRSWLPDPKAYARWALEKAYYNCVEVKIDA